MTRILAFALCSAAALAPTPALADTSRDDVPQIFTMSPTGVNLQTGVFVHSETDFTIGSLAFVRSWRAVPSFAPAGGISGLDHHAFAAWNHNFGFGARWHQTAPDGVNIYADGKVYQFRVNNAGTIWTPWNLDQHNNNAFGAKLTGTMSSNLVFTNQAGDVYTLNANNQATRLERADGTRLDLTYDGSKRLRTVISNRGEAIVLDYGSNGRLATACGYNLATAFVGPSTTCAAAAVKTSYGYSSTSAAQGWNLTSVTGPDLVTTSMTYDTYFKPNLTCITVPGSGACRIANVYGPQPGDPSPPLTRPDQVRRQTTATGEVWTYFYLNAEIYADWPPLQYGEIRQTESDMTDPLGRVTHVEYENGFLKRVHAPEGLTQYGWAMLNPTVFTWPGGTEDRLQYDMRHNLVTRRKVARPNSGLADIVATATFPAACDATNFRVCDKPTATTDENGNTTDYTYDLAHGGVLTATRPAPTAGAVRPQNRYSYAQLHAGVKNSGGAIVSAATPVWVLTEEAQCRTQASCGGTPDEIRTIYHYGASGTANALRLKGKTVTGDGVTARTCFGYDALGNPISETGPGGAPATCP